MLQERYRRDLARSEFVRDPAQAVAVEKLDTIASGLAARKRAPTPVTEARSSGLLGKLFSAEPAASVTPEPVQGLYLWGGVGRGKTYLMDIFYEVLPFKDKKRLHFHRFMNKVHHDLKGLKQQQSPLRSVARRWAAETRVLCLDEFFVNDITDAMILHGLLEALFDNGVSLVTTSNIPPDQLYRNGLQRARFLPAIELLKKHLEVFHLDSGTDYRLRYLETAEIFHQPLDQGADLNLKDAFEHVAPEKGRPGVELEVEGRKIPSRYLADGVVWFDFPAICDGPRSQNDYIEISRCFHTVLISNVPVMGRDMENQARRFLNLVDEFYDRRVKLFLSLAAPVEEIYQGEKLKFEYERVQSRLQEMQSREYLAAGHLP